MIYVGIDDTDTRETPGTNKLAMYLSELLRDRFETRWIVRHQLLEDPRVPCTNRNGCVSLLFEPLGSDGIAELTNILRDEIVRWIPEGSDPGLCIVTDAPERLSAWGRTAQQELVTQAAAWELARTLDVHLEALGGTGDGVIGALAAIGLLATWNSGRVIRCYRVPADAFDLTGEFTVEQLYQIGVDDIFTIDDGRRLAAGTVNLGKRLRPNLRDGRMVLYVAGEGEHYEAQRVVA